MERITLTAAIPLFATSTRRIAWFPPTLSMYSPNDIPGAGVFVIIVCTNYGVPAKGGVVFRVERGASQREGQETVPKSTGAQRGHKKNKEPYLNCLHASASTAS
jgi:hypothetical protein